MWVVGFDCSIFLYWHPGCRLSCELIERCILLTRGAIWFPLGGVSSPRWWNREEATLR